MPYVASLIRLARPILPRRSGPGSTCRAVGLISFWVVTAMILQMALGGTMALGMTLPAETPPIQRADVIIYGGSSAGIAAAIQATRMGKSVIVIEPGKHLGGLTSGGLGATDIGNKAAIGGISREFYQRVKAHYDQPTAWRFQQASAYQSRRQQAGDDAMWTFEPHVAEAIFDQWVTELEIPVVKQAKLDREQGITLAEGRIVEIRTLDGKSFQGKYFIDATYEGDLMALANVRYHIGRESNATYQETLNGVQTRQATKHQLVNGVDPYVVKGDPASGLLPGVHDQPPGEEGSGDHRVQAYCFRMCTTDAPENRIPFEKPADYDPLRYELLLRNFEAGATVAPWHPTPMPNRKTDTNNNRGFSTDNINMNYRWPEASYAEREVIFQEHLTYQRGLVWTLANHPRVPESIRREVSRWGNCRDEFPEHNGWSHQLYVREARRMIGQLVMTQHHCQGHEVVEDSVGLAAYTMDSHNTQRYVDAQGFARNEGDVQVGGFPPYPISYGAIVPREQECSNLLVPVCLSASHIAYGSIRMEPVFMVLGQSAATAACLALDQDLPIQKVSYTELRQRLLQDKQVLDWTGPRPPTGLALKSLPGIVVDDSQAELGGAWTSSTSQGGFVGSHYLHDSNESKGSKSARFPFTIPRTGRYEVRVAYTSHSNRASNLRGILNRGDAPKFPPIEFKLDQRQRPNAAPFHSLGIWSFVQGAKGSVQFSTADTDGYVVIDAIQLLPVTAGR